MGTTDYLHDISREVIIREDALTHDTIKTHETVSERALRPNAAVDHQRLITKKTNVALPLSRHYACLGTTALSPFQFTRLHYCFVYNIFLRASSASQSLVVHPNHVVDREMDLLNEWKAL